MPQKTSPHCYNLFRILDRNGIDRRRIGIEVCPYDTLKWMNINENRSRDSQIIIHTLDGSRREIIGEIKLSVEIGPYTFTISFQVLNITTRYNLLLGRPWIHMVGAVLSTLHQQLKYIINGELVTIMVEDGKIKTNKDNIPVTDLDESTELPSFQAFEISTTSYLPLGTLETKPRMFEEVFAVAKEISVIGFQPGQGLGKSGQGILHPINIPTQKNKAGLGYRAKSRKGGFSKKNQSSHITIQTQTVLRRTPKDAT